jgi:hypothetical protein
MRFKKKTRKLERQLRVRQIDYEYRIWWYSHIRRCTRTLTTSVIDWRERWRTLNEHFCFLLKKSSFSNNLRKIEARRGRITRITKIQK